MSRAVYEELVRAGAPELPEGLFYRIRERHQSLVGDMYEMQIRERRRLWKLRWSRSTGSETFFHLSEYTKERTDVQAFAYIALCIYDERRRQLEQYASILRARRLLGDHP